MHNLYKLKKLMCQAQVVFNADSETLYATMFIINVMNVYTKTFIFWRSYSQLWKKKMKLSSHFYTGQGNADQQWCKYSWT